MKKISLLLMICSSLFLSTVFLNTSAYSQEDNFGIINRVDHDRGLIMIDDWVYLFRNDEIEVNYKNRRVRTIFLLTGVRVRFEADGDGVVKRIFLLGPAEALEQISER